MCRPISRSWHIQDVCKFVSRKFAQRNCIDARYVQFSGRFPGRSILCRQSTDDDNNNGTRANRQASDKQPLRSIPISFVRRAARRILCPSRRFADLIVSIVSVHSAGETSELRVWKNDELKHGNFGVRIARIVSSSKRLRPSQGCQPSERRLESRDRVVLSLRSQRTTYVWGSIRSA